MDTHVRTPMEIFTQPQHLVVPPFQRPYVWEQDEQWEPFWQDIRLMAESRVANPAAFPTHFLGAVVIQAQDQAVGNLQVNNVIDGQQRLTTLHLLMDAVAAVLEESGNDALAAQLEMLTHNQAIYVASGSTRLKIRHLNRDREAFDEVLGAEPPIDHSLLIHAGSRVARGHEFFAGAVAHWLGPAQAPDFTPRAEGLVHVLSRGLQLVAINLSANENSQEIFETLNARGTPLTAADLIKNFVFQRLSSEGVDTAEAYRRDWPFETPFWEAEVSVGRYLMSRSSLFFSQWLVSRLGEEISPKSTFSRFKRYVEGGDLAMTDLLPVIKRDAARYKEWTTAADDSDRQLSAVEMAFYRMRATDVELLKPLILWLHAPERDASIPVIDDVVAAAESWVIRRQMLRLAGSDLGRIVADIIREYSHAASSELPGLVSAHLAGLNVSSTYWPGDEEIRRGLLTEQAFRRYKRGRLRMLLEAIEDDFRRGTNQPQVARRGYPIEHILPQKWAEHWPVEGPEAEQDRAAHVHRLGNLTLLTKSLNSQVSNGPWQQKREALQEHDTFLLNSRLLASSVAAAWDEAGIDQRSATLIEGLLAVWPVPDGHQGEVVDPGPARSAGIEIRHLIAAGLLAPDTVLVPRNGPWGGKAARVLPDGALEVDGRRFTSPSGAGAHVRGGSTNGWTFWRIPDGRTLNQLRAAHAGQGPESATEPIDWTTLHQILEGMPEGAWTTYGDLADAVGADRHLLERHISICPQCDNPTQLATTGEMPASQESGSLPDGAADAQRQLDAEALAALIGMGGDVPI